ncbi:hypothetical protein CIP106467_4780 [Citrobacter europaeus]|nr:hypothetical protein CIP106467_4780 [Citrobacter europaeus]
MDVNIFMAWIFFAYVAKHNNDREKVNRHDANDYITVTQRRIE